MKRMADEYGIVMGTSHQEPMLRAQKEWDRRYRGQRWNYYTDPKTLSLLPVLAVLGFIFCLLYERTGTLLAPIALHAINNGIAYASTVHSAAALSVGLAAAVVAGAFVVAMTPAWLWHLHLYGSPLGPSAEGAEGEYKYTSDTWTVPAVLATVIRNIGLHLGTPSATVNATSSQCGPYRFEKADQSEIRRNPITARMHPKAKPEKTSRLSTRHRSPNVSSPSAGHCASVPMTCSFATTARSSG